MVSLIILETLAVILDSWSLISADFFCFNLEITL